MLELKPFEDWSATSDAADPTAQIKGYADYVRTSYFKAGQLTDEVENGIKEGVRDVAISNGLLPEEAPEEEKELLVSQLVAPKPSVEKEARFLLDHYAIDYNPNGTDPESVDAREKANTLRRYFAIKQANPEALPSVEPLVAEMVSNPESVIRARRAAVDRGDAQLVAYVDVDGRRQIHTGSGTNPESVRGKLDSLLATGAIDADDFKQVSGLIAPVNGGKAHAADLLEQSTFENTVASLSKADPELKDALDRAVSELAQQQKMAGQTTGEAIIGGVKTLAAAPFVVLGELAGQVFGGEEKKTTPKRNIADILSDNKAMIDKGFTPQSIARFTSDMVQRQAGPAYRADKPDTGITTDSLGNPIIAQALVPNKEQFESALATSALNEEQKLHAIAERTDQLARQAPALKRLIVENDDEAAAAYAQAKATGLSDTEFVEKWVSEKGSNYSGFSERLQQFGSGVGNTLASIPLGLATLTGSETATKLQQSMNKDRTDRQEYSRLMGDEYGLAFQIVDAVPQVASDILLTAGSAGALTALKVAAKGGTRAVLKAAAKNAASLADEPVAAAIKSAAQIGNEAKMASALKELGVNTATKLNVVERNVPLFATTFYRSANSSYVSTYSQLPDTMSHEEKHKAAIGYAVGSGLSTAAVTLGMGFLGRGGVEDLASGIFKPLRATDEIAEGSKVIPLDKLNYRQAKLAHEAINNAGRKLTDAEFKSVMRVELGGAYKNYLRTSFKGFLDEGTEEAIDQAIAMKIEDAALDRSTPVMEKVDQIWHSFVIGGALGGGAPAITQLAAPLQFSERVEALQASVDYSKKIAGSLRDGGSPATAELFERNIQQQVAELTSMKQREAAAQEQVGQEKASDTQAFTDDEAADEGTPLAFDAEGQSELQLGVKPEAPKSNLVVGDLVGERVFVGNFGGTLERSADGSFRVALDTPLEGSTHLRLGVSPYQSIEKAGIRRKSPLMVLSTAAGDIPAGTPYVVPNKSKKTRFALPANPTNFEFTEIDGEEVLVVKGARMVGNSTVTTPLHITDPDQIASIAKRMKLTRPEGPLPETQLELDLFAPTAETPEVTEELEGEFNADLEEELDRVEVEEALAILSREDESTTTAISRIAVEGKADPQAIREAASAITPEQLAAFYGRLSNLESFALELPEGKAGVRDRILENAASLRLLTDMVRDSAVPDLIKGKLEKTPAKTPAIEPPPPIVTEPTPVAPTPTTPAAATPAAAAATPAAPTPTPEPKAKKPRAPRKTAVPVVIPPDVTVQDIDEPSPQDRILALREEALGLDDPEITLKGQTFTLSQVREELARYNLIADNRRKVGVPPSDKTITQISNMQLFIRTAEERSAIRRSEIEEQIALIENPIQVLESEQTIADALKAIETGRKPATQLQQKEVKTPTYRHSMVESGVPLAVGGIEFRNSHEAETVTEWANGGFLVTDLAERGGFNPKKEGPKGESLDYAPKGSEPYSLRVKKYLLSRVQEQFPFVPVPEGTETINSKLSFVPMDGKGKAKHIPLPTIRDSNGKAIEGIFTNDPRVTASQLDLGLLVVVPPDFIDRLNPSITVEPDGRVALVRLWPSHKGVAQAGGLSEVGKSTWTPIQLEKDSSLDALLSDPAPQFLPEAPDIEGKPTFAKIIQNALADLQPPRPKGENETLLDTMRSERAFKVQGIMFTKRVSKENAEMVALSSAMQFSLSLKQQALANKIRSAQQADPNASLASLIREELKNPESGSSDALTDEAILGVFSTATRLVTRKSTTNKKTGATTVNFNRTAEQVLTSYGEQLLKDYPDNVVPNLTQIVLKASDNAKSAQKNRRALERSNASISMDQPMEGTDFVDPRVLLASKEDVITQVTEAEDSIFGSLATLLKGDEEMRRTMTTAVGRALKQDLPPMEVEDLIALADKTIGGRDSAAQRFAREMQSAEADPIREALKEIVRDRNEARLSRSAENVQATGAARSANSSEINRLGLVSGSPESVLAALRQLAKTGDPNTRLVANLLASFPDLIRGTNFVIGDFDDVRFAGAFMPKSNLVVLNLSGHNGRGLVDVLLHEYIHAATTNLLLNPTTATQRAAVARIEQLRKLVSVRVNALGYSSDQFNDALASNDEFVTYALTDPKFQALVKGVTPKSQRSLFSRIVEAILELFGVQKGGSQIDPVEELLDFVNMLGSETTFLLDSRREIRNEAREIAQGIDDLRDFLKASQQMLSTYRDGDGPDVRLAAQPAVEQEEFSGELAMDPVSEFRNQLPEGFTAVEDVNLAGEAGIRRSDPTVIFINPALLANRLAGLNKRGAKAAIRGLINHEVGHAAVAAAFTNEQVQRVASELGPDQLQRIAEDYYGGTGMTIEQVRQRIADDRASGTLTDEMLADEWLRMTVTKATMGSSYEQDLQYAAGNPTLLDAVVRAIQTFVAKLRQRFVDYPSAETAADISHAERALRKLTRSGNPDAGQTAPTFGDSEAFLDALDGVIDGDRVLYSLPVASSNPQKVDSFMESVRKKLYNLPFVLREVVNARNGAINSLTVVTKDFLRTFPKLRDAALDAGVSIEDIRLLFGTTAPPITSADEKAIEVSAATYAATLDPNLSDAARTEAVDKKRAALQSAMRMRFSTAFRVRQQAAEASVRAQGFNALVDKAIAVRKETNKGKEIIGFDESNDVYLTRAYRFFHTTGWSMAAKSDAIVTIEGKQVDFGKLRTLASRFYRDQARADFKAAGKPYTSADLDAKTLDMLDLYLGALEKLGGNADPSLISGLRDDLNRFKPKKDIDGAFRELLGEIDDPMTNAVNTLYRVGMLAANHNFRDAFAKQAITLGLASRTPVDGWAPAYPSSTIKTMGPMAGLYMDPSAAAALKEAFGANLTAVESNSTQMMNKFGRMVSRMSGVAVFNATQLGIGYWPRNVIGGFVLSAAQGIAFNPFSKRGQQAMMDSVKTAFSRIPTDEAKRTELLRLTELNILSDQSAGRMVQDLTRGLIGAPEQDLLDMMADLEEARATKDMGGWLARVKKEGKYKAVSDIIGKSYTKTTEVAGALDAAIDGMFKANAYYFELAELQKFHGNGKDKADLEVLAARKVKLTFAGHSQVIDPVKSFSRMPLAAIFMPFARWKSEVFRTMVNTPQLAMEEIKQGGSMGVRGYRRLGGFLATTVGAPSLLGGLMMAVFGGLTGDDEEEDRKLESEELAGLREALPIWQRGHHLYARALKDGSVQFIDMSYLLPHSQLTDMVNIIVDGVRNDGAIDGSRLAEYVTGDLIGTQIFATAVDEVLNNEDDFGQPIYVSTDPAPTKMARMMAHIGRSAGTPSAIKKGMDFFREGQPNREEMFWGEVLGGRPKTQTFAEIERKGFRNLKSVQDEAVSIIGELSGGRFISDEDMDEVVDRHQDALNETQHRMSRFMKVMQGLGSPESSVVSSALAAKFSKATVQSAYDGYRIPWRPNAQWYAKLRANAEAGKEQDPDQKAESVLRSVNRKPDLYWVNGNDEP